jgi:ABC-type lipoprotein release transport system permease subunit
MLKLIIYNLFKHKVIFGLIGGLVLLSTFYMVIGLNALFTVNDTLVKAVANNVAGDLIIIPAEVEHIDLIGMAGEKKINPLKNPEALGAFLKKNPRIRGVASRLRVRGIVRSERNIFPVMLIGVDPAGEPDLLPRRLLEKGRWLTGENEAILYYRHADRLSMELGEMIGINIQTLDGYMNFDTATLVGEVDYEDLDYYSEISFYTFLSINFVNRLIMSDQPIVGEVVVRLEPESASALSVIESIKAEFGDIYHFVTPEHSSYLVESITRLIHFLVFFVAILLLFMVYLACNLLVNLSIETRRREIGIYMALGVSALRIALLFGGELFLIISIFSAAGILVGNEALKFFLDKGIEASIIPLQLIFGTRMVFIERFAGTYISIIVLLALVLVATIASAVYKLISCEPVDLVREL